MAMTPQKFMGLLFQSRDTMHLAHLNTSSFAEHKALGHYYDSILDLTDSFIEKHFGRNKRLQIIIPESKVEDAVAHMKMMQQTLEAEMPNYPDDLQNIMQEMLGLVNNTLYLLTLT